MILKLFVQFVFIFVSVVICIAWCFQVFQDVVFIVIICVCIEKWFV